MTFFFAPSEKVTPVSLTVHNSWFHDGLGHSAFTAVAKLACDSHGRCVTKHLSFWQASILVPLCEQMWEELGHRTQEALAEWAGWGGARRVGWGGVGWLASAWETGSTPPPRLAAWVKLGAARGRRSAPHIPEQERVAGAVLLLVSQQGLGPTSGSGRIKGFPALGFQASGVGSVTCNYVSNSHHPAIARDMCSLSSARETVTPGRLRPAAGDTPMVSWSEVPFASPAAAKFGQAQVRRGGAGP